MIGHLRPADLDTHKARADDQQWREVADQARPRVPKLAALTVEAETDVLACMSFPAQHRAKLHSTDRIERLNGEIKRRSDVVGIFPNEAALVRLIGAIRWSGTTKVRTALPLHDAGSHRATGR